MDKRPGSRPTWGGYLVGAYLFCTVAFGSAEGSVLLIIPQVVGALLVGYALYDILSRFAIRIPAEIGFYALLGLWAAFTRFIGSGVGLTPALATLLKIVVTALACAQLIKTESDLLTALRMFVCSIFVVFAQNVGDLSYLSTIGRITEDDRFAGTLLNANSAAIFALTVVWASIVLLIRSKRVLFRWVWYALPIGQALVIIYYSGSKKGLIGLGLLVLFATRLWYKRQPATVLRKGFVILASAALIVVVGYFIYTSPFFFRVQQLFQGITTNDSDMTRWDLAREAIDVWLMNAKAFFIGVGYDNFRIFSSVGTYAHSTPFELLAGCGIIGLSLFLAFLGLLVRKFIRLYRTATDPESRSFYFAIDIFLGIYTFFMATAVMHDARDLIPILACLAGFGQSQLQLQSDAGEANASEEPHAEAGPEDSRD